MLESDQGGGGRRRVFTTEDTEGTESTEREMERLRIVAIGLFWRLVAVVKAAAGLPHSIEGQEHRQECLCHAFRNDGWACAEGSVEGAVEDLGYLLDF
jgi:hypothetical protein